MKEGDLTSVEVVTFFVSKRSNLSAIYRAEMWIYIINSTQINTTSLKCF